MRSSTIIKISEAIGCRAGELYDDYKETDKANKIVCPHCKKEIEFEIKIK